MYDLLDSAAAGGLQLRENMKNGVFADGLLEQTVGSAADAYNVSPHSGNLKFIFSLLYELLFY